MKLAIRSLVVAASLVLVASCGSDNSGGDDGASGGSDPAWTGDTALKPAKIGVLNVLASSEAQKHWEDTAKKALDAIGYESVIIDGKGDPAVEGQAINSFVQQQVDAIMIIGGIEPATLAEPLRQAQSADIPVVTTGVSSPNDEGLLSGVYAPDDAEFGTQIAPYLIDHLPEGAPYVALDLTAAAGAQAPNDAVQPLLEEAGHERVGGIDIELSGDIPTQVSKGTADLMSAHPDAKLIFGCCDFSAAITDPVLESTGHEDVIQSVRYDNLSTLQLIRDGSNVVTQAVNSDQGVLFAIGQIASHLSSDTDFADSVPADTWEWTVVDAENLPEEGKFYYDPDEQIDAWVKQLQTEYSK